MSLRAAGVAVALRALADDIETTAALFTTDLARLAERLDRALDQAADLTGEIKKIVPRDSRIEISEDRMTVLWRGAEVPRFPPLLFSITRYMVRRPGIVRERGEILGACWPLNDEREPRAVDTAMKRIRTQFRRIDPRFDAIETVYGVGFVWRLGP